jgi:hypothetical protein
MRCRKRIGDVETGGKSLTRDESGACPDCGPGGIRHEGGVTLNRALARNVGTCRLDGKGAIQTGGPREDRSTDAGHRGGAARISDEGSAVELEGRGLGCSALAWGQPARAGPISDRPEDGLWEEPRG